MARTLVNSAPGATKDRSGLKRPSRSPSAAPSRQDVRRLGAEAILVLQRLAGNRSVVDLIVQRKCGNAKKHMYETAKNVAEVVPDLILYTGTDDQKHFQRMIAFNGTLEEFAGTFMTHNVKQKQSAQMGAGIYATTSRSDALGYGAYTVKITPKEGCKYLDLSDTTVTKKMKKDTGVNPAQWGGANPDCIVKFRAGGYHVVKTNLVTMSADDEGEQTSEQ